MNKVSKRLIAALEEAKEKGLVSLESIPNTMGLKVIEKLETGKKIFDHADASLEDLNANK